MDSRLKTLLAFGIPFLIVNILLKKYLVVMGITITLFVVGTKLYGK